MDNHITPSDAPNMEIDWAKVERTFDDHCAALGISLEVAVNAAGVAPIDIEIMPSERVLYPAQTFLRICAWCDVNPLSLCKVMADA